MEQITAKEQVIQILERRMNEAFCNGGHNHEKKRMVEAIASIEELIPPDMFASLRSVSETKFAPIQLCPKCHGDGNLGRYNSPNSYSDIPICDVCNGSKTIPQFPVPVSEGCQCHNCHSLPVSEVGQMDAKDIIDDYCADLTGAEEDLIRPILESFVKKLLRLPVPNTKKETKP